MTLSDTYQTFLDRPSQGALAEKAALHYITTLTSIYDAAAIVKHLSVQEKLLKKTKQKVLSVVEGTHGLSLDVETTIEFQNGGGAYLPGLDDNFVADRTVTFPMVHIVHFDSADKIVQIRQYWDQGSLLKQIDVIGARSRNWPIREGPEQARLIKSAVAVAQPDSPSSSRPSTASRGAGDVSIRSRGPTTNVTNDPHASLSLFKAREVDEENLPGTYETAPRALSAKPPPREYSELFVDENAASPSAQNQRFPAKGGSSKNFKNNRLFEETEEDSAAASTPLKSIRTNPKKYNHFEFGDGNDDEVETPPATRKTQAPFKGNTSNAGQGLYKNHITGDDDDEGTAHSDGRALNNDTKQTRNKNRSKDFGAHWEMHDNSPANTKSNENYRPGKGAHQATKNNFDFYDESPQQSSYKINIAGNGMGNRAGTQFSLFDDEPEKPAAEDRTIGNHKGIRATGDGMGGRKGADKSFWDF